MSDSPGKLAKPLFGLGFKVSQISVKSSGCIHFIKDKRKFETNGKPVFNGKYLIVKEVKSFSSKYSYYGYYNFDFGTYSLMRTNSGKKSFPLGSEVRPKTTWEDKGAISTWREQKKSSIKFLLDQPGFGPRILRTDLARYIKNSNTITTTVKLRSKETF